mmetsp:Transcript_44068/g.128292  ORF Transcript_44068/g.128292 Transcript_44068/m.128292 type:complete len:228 (-) Transcript_44068:482-1165(-)
MPSTPSETLVREPATGAPTSSRASASFTRKGGAGTGRRALLRTMSLSCSRGRIFTNSGCVPLSRLSAHAPPAPAASLRMAHRSCAGRSCQRRRPWSGVQQSQTAANSPRFSSSSGNISRRHSCSRLDCSCITTSRALRGMRARDGHRGSAIDSRRSCRRSDRSRSRDISNSITIMANNNLSRCRRCLRKSCTCSNIRSRSSRPGPEASAIGGLGWQPPKRCNCRCSP